MSTRRASESDSSSDSRMEKIGSRVRQRAMSGTEASTVGFVLVLYVFAGAGLGYLADKFFETNWIVGAGVLAGSAWGFREMFRMIKQISRIDAKNSEAAEAQERQELSRKSQITPLEYSAPESSDSQIADAEGKKPNQKKSAFQIPPPPTPSFDSSKNNPKSPQ